MSKESESYRLQMLRNLKDRYGKAKPAEVLEAEKVIAQFREQETHDREAIARLSAPLPEPDLCPRCYFYHGKRSLLRPIPARDPKHFDAMKCRECEYVEERKFRD